MVLILALMACGPSKEDRARLDALLTSLPQEMAAVDAAEQAFQARTVGFPDREGALERAGLADRFEAARADLQAAKACAEGLTGSVHREESRAWQFRCHRLVERAGQRALQADAALTRWEEAWEQAPERLASSQFRYEALLARVEEPLARSRVGRVKQASSEVQQALTRLEAGLQGRQAEAVADALEALDAALAELTVQVEDVERDLRAHAQEQELVATRLTRTATYWIRPEVADRQHSKVRWREQSWEEVDVRLYERYLANPQAERHSKRLVDHRIVATSELTLHTRVREEDGWRIGPSLTIPLPESAVAPIVDAWSGWSAKISAWDATGPTSADGVATELSIRGSVVLAHKEAGVWPERREWLANLPEPLVLPPPLVAP